MEESFFEKMGLLVSNNDAKLLVWYDELSFFLTQINLYGSKGISDSHDTATFLMLYNGHGWTRRTGKLNFKILSILKQQFENNHIVQLQDMQTFKWSREQH